MDTERFFRDAYGPDDEALADALRWLVEYANEHGHSRGAILVSALHQVNSLGRVLGAETAKAFRRDRVMVIDGVSIDLLLGSRLPTQYTHGPVMAAWQDDDQLERIDGLRAPALGVLAWRQEDIEKWKAARNPIDISTGERVGTDDATGNPVVTVALQALSEHNNLNAALSHPYDKAAAIGMLQLLLKAGEYIDPSHIRATAVKKGWRPEDASELADLAGKLIDGRRVQNRYGQHWRDDIVEQWRAEAEGS